MISNYFHSRLWVLSSFTLACLLAFSSFVSIPYQAEHPLQVSLEHDGVTTEEILLAQRIEGYLYTRVPGMNITYRDVFNLVMNEGYNVWLTGGAIRDLILSDNPQLNDLDFSFDCTIEQLEEILTRNEVLYTKIPNYLVINIGTREGVAMEGIESAYAIHARDEEREFTVNNIYYHVNTATFEPEFKKGIQDLNDRKLAVKAKNLSEWLYGGQSERPIKIFRYWKMLGKGFSASPELERFMAYECVKAFKKDPEAFRHHLLQYIGSHFSSFDQVRRGCMRTMGSRWTRENFEVFYEQARKMDIEVDAIWEESSSRSLQAQGDIQVPEAFGETL
ncbi:hypothetical protein [Estrella lausannensis]|uniref:Conserved putative secreted protein n=1 Tax=Estrella lausannensis TaxID=483423 RepID=A0A0H5DS89_9BACT|nr:hypothetical protein [Estrella lausannensis]CRX38599.1 Conserved putative secreted protein [Estrella lausannensis]